MPSKAVIQYIGEIRDLVAKQNKLEAANRKITKSLQELKRAGKTAGQQTGQSFGDAAKSVGKMALAFGGVNSAAAILHKTMSIITAEFDNIRKRREEAAGAVGTIAQERAIALKNIPRGQEALFERIVEEAATRKELPLGRAAGFQLAGSVFSGASGLSLGQKEAVFKEAAKEAALTKQPEVAFAGTLADIVKVIPELRERKDPKEAATIAAGVIEEFGKAARSVDRDAQATLLRRLAASAVGTDTSFEKTFELGAAIAQGGGDVEGNITATVVGRLFKNLRIARTKGFPVGGGQFLKVTGRGDEGLQQLMDQVSRLTPQQKDVFFQSFALGRSNIGFAVADVIGRTDRGQSLLGAAEREISPIGEAGAARTARLKTAREGKFGAFAKLERQFNALIETQRLKDIDPALAGLIQERLPEALRAFGQPAIAQRFAEFKLLGPAKRALPAAIGEIEDIIEDLDPSKPGIAMQQQQAVFRGEREPRSERQATAAGLREVVETMKGIREGLDRLDKANANVEDTD